MLIAAQAWNLKAWLALSLPPSEGRRSEKQKQEQERTGLLRMEFRTFVNAFVRIPCQVVRTGRKIVHRLLGWKACMVFAGIGWPSRPCRSRFASCF
jgi:hypothetical protein